MVNLSQGNSTARGRSYFLTAEATPGLGLAASKTVMVYRYLNAGNLYKANGLKERESPGSRD